MNLASTISVFCGGLGSGCNPSVGKCGRTVTVWHGTTADRAKKIKKQGLRPGKSINIAREEGHVYVSKDAKGALFFAYTAVEDRGGVPALVRFEVPESVANKFKADHPWKGYKNFAHKGSLHQKYVKEVHEVSLKEMKKWGDPAKKTRISW